MAMARWNSVWGLPNHAQPGPYLPEGSYPAAPFVDYPATPAYASTPWPQHHHPEEVSNLARAREWEERAAALERQASSMSLFDQHAVASFSRLDHPASLARVDGVADWRREGAAVSMGAGVPTTRYGAPTPVDNIFNELEDIKLRARLAPKVRSFADVREDHLMAAYHAQRGVVQGVAMRAEGYARQRSISPEREGAPLGLPVVSRRHVTLSEASSLAGLEADVAALEATSGSRLPTSQGGVVQGGVESYWHVSPVTTDTKNNW